MTQDDGPAKYNHAGLDKKNQNKLSDKTCSANHLTNIFALWIKVFSRVILKSGWGNHVAPYKELNMFSRLCPHIQDLIWNWTLILVILCRASHQSHHNTIKSVLVLVVYFTQLFLLLFCKLSNGFVPSNWFDMMNISKIEIKETALIL